MPPISPALTQAYTLLTQEIYEFLDAAEELAELAWDSEREALGRRAIANLSIIVRGLAATHRATGEGRCDVCQRAWPCQVTETIHAILSNRENAFKQIIHTIWR